MKDVIGKRLWIVILCLSVVFTGATAIEAAQTLVFFDSSWDSALVHNRIAGFIAEHGFGFEPDYLLVDTILGYQGMRRGDVDVSMETWTDNIAEIWAEATAAGDIIDLGPNFPNAPQGWYVPTYMIKGDPERGIEPVTPDLKSVEDLADYWEVFKDRENPRKGRFYNGVTGWLASEINLYRLEGYGLDKYYDVFYPGSQTALDTSILRAYERGEPWFGYYWEPTWIMGALDMTMLDEPTYSDTCWETGNYACAFPAASVRISATRSLADRSPGFVEFLRKYETTLEQTNAALTFMEMTGGDATDGAHWFLREFEDLWTKWLEPEVAAKVKAALDEI